MALAVDCDPGPSSPFKADWDSVGQCEMDWDNAYPWIFMALASLGRLGQRGILGQSSILDNLQGRVGQCGLGQDWDNGYPLDIHGVGWIPIGYAWHWHPCVDWDSWNPGTILDLRHPSRQTGTMWGPVFRVDWGNLQIHGYGTAWNPGTIFHLRQPSRQTGTVWTGAGLGQWIPIGYSWHWHPWVDWDSVCKSMDTHRIFMALASLRRLGQLESWDNLGS